MQSAPKPKCPADARHAALNTLRTIVAEGKTLDEALRSAVPLIMETRERAYARLLVMTVLRRRGEIEAVLGQFLSKPLPAKAQSTTLVLWLGIAQLLYLETPPHAAVHSSVDLAGKVDRGGFKGLVNAVLKRVASEGNAVRRGLHGATVPMPEWLWQKLKNDYGDDTLRAMAATHLQEPPLDVSVKKNAAEWAAALSADLLPTGSLRLHKAGPIESLPGFAQGAWWVQDMAAALPVKLLGDLGGKIVWDLCAAPGGKTLQLAAAGSRVLSVDNSQARMQRLKENLARTGLEAEIKIGDARCIMADTVPDAILLDAPCSATGTLRRHPDVAWHRSEKEIAALVRLQQELLDHAADSLKPGGRLVYCVCSLLKEEGEEQMDAFFIRRPHMRLSPVAREELLGLTQAVTPQGVLRTLPHYLADTGGMDGFFAFRAERMA